MRVNLKNSFHVMNHERVPVHDDRIKIWSQSEKRTRIGNSHRRARGVRPPVRRYPVFECSDLNSTSCSSLPPPTNQRSVSHRFVFFVSFFIFEGDRPKLTLSVRVILEGRELSVWVILEGREDADT